MKKHIHNTTLALGFGGLLWALARARRGQFTLQRRLDFLREMSALGNPRFGVERSIGAVLEQLRAFYDVDCCLLVTHDANRNSHYSQRADALDGQGASRRIPLSPQLACQFLASAPTQAVIYHGRSPRSSLAPLYEVTTSKPVARSRLRRMRARN